MAAIEGFNSLLRTLSLSWGPFPLNQESSGNMHATRNSSGWRYGGDKERWIESQVFQQLSYAFFSLAYQELAHLRSDQRKGG